MKSYFGSYYTSPGTEPIDSTVLVFDKNLNIGFRNPNGSNAMINWPLKYVETSFDFSSHQSKLRYTKNPGCELVISGNDPITFIKEMQAEQQKVWYKKSNAKEWMRNSFLFVCIIAVLFLLYLLIVPWLSQKMASRVSIKTEKQLGDAVYDAMGLAEREDTSKSMLLNQFFDALEVPTAYTISISVVNDNVVNAFALPGGRIVVYSALLNKITSFPELAALLSHEFTHINRRHTTKSIFRRLGSKIFISLLFGRFGTVTSVLANNADNLKSLKYSRRLEKEADMDGLAILTKRGIDPGGFVNLFIHLKEAGTVNKMPEFLGSHPDVKNRIAYIQEASKDVTLKEQVQLKAIFEKLK